MPSKTQWLKLAIAISQYTENITKADEGESVVPVSGRVMGKIVKAIYADVHKDTLFSIEEKMVEFLDRLVASD